MGTGETRDKTGIGIERNGREVQRLGNVPTLTLHLLSKKGQGEGGSPTWGITRWKSTGDRKHRTTSEVESWTRGLT